MVALPPLASVAAVPTRIGPLITTVCADVIRFSRVVIWVFSTICQFCNVTVGVPPSVNVTDTVFELLINRRTSALAPNTAAETEIVNGEAPVR